MIIEVYSWQSEDLYCMHDVYYPIGALPPNRVPLPIQNAGDRIGDKVMKIDADKVIAIIETNDPDRNTPFKPLDDDSRAIAGTLLDFLGAEVKAGRLPKTPYFSET